MVAALELDVHVAERAAAVSAALRRELARLAEALPQPRFALAAAPELLAELALRGGKRLRGVLLVEAALAWGAPDEAPLLRAAAALEILETAVLVHDDLVDGDEERRGGPTVHCAVARSAAARGLAPARARRVGDGAALAAGDLGIVWAHALLADVGAAAGTGARLAAVVHDCLARCALGEALELDLQTRPADAVALADVEAVAALKTASYTCELPLRLAAALAGVPAGRDEAIRAVAEPLGVAFQLRDDLLGLAGDPAPLGRRRAVDLLAGVWSAPLVVAFACAAAGPRAVLARVFGAGPDGAGPAGAAAIDEALGVVRDCGALTAVQERAEALVAAALARFPELGWSAAGHARMAALATFLVRRHG